MAKTSKYALPDDQFILTTEELAAVKKARESTSTIESEIAPESQQMLANALITAIESTRPPSKKTPFNRVKGGPWEPKDGSKKPKLRRTMLQHGVELNESILSSDEIHALNKVKAGKFGGNFFKVIKRRDGSIDIDYPIKTASQRLKLVNQFGIRSLEELCQFITNEAAKPKSADADDDE